MPWYAWAMVIYLAVDRLTTVAMCGRGRKIDITPGFATTSLVTGAVFIWGIVSLAS